MSPDDRYPASLDDAVLGIEHAVRRLKEAINDGKWPSVLAGFDRIVELSNEGFDRAGAMAGPDSRSGI